MRTATSPPTPSGTRSPSRSGANVEQELPDLDAQLEAGEFGPLYEWLRDRLYRHGRKFTPMETLERAIGADAIDPQPYLEYLRAKVGSLQSA